VGVSLDGQKNENDQARINKNGNSSFDEVIKGINILKKEKVLFNILSVVTSANYQNISSTYSFFKSQGLDYIQFIPCLFFINKDNPLTLLPSQWLTFQKELFNLWYEDFNKGIYISIRHFDNYVNLLNHHPADGCAFNGTCGQYVVCESNGDLYPCDFYCLDSYKLGNIQNDKLTEVFNNIIYKNFTNESLLISNNCNGCLYKSLCRGGCKKDRENDYLTNRFCSSTKEFFDYSFTRIKIIADKAKKGLFI
jgi:uncharacterized protein